jgi:integrase
MCQRCGNRPQAYQGRGLCYDCKPGTRGRPLPCKRCGSADDYWSSGLCRRCHQYAPQLPDSCRDCLAWPVLRIRGWTCQACAAWRIWYPQAGACLSCHRVLHLNPHQACRLCWMQAKLAQPAVGLVDVIAGNRHGQQLTFADMSSPKNGYRPHPRRPWRKPKPPPDQPPLPPQIPGQFDLLAPDWLADAACRYGFGDPPSIILADQLDAAVLDHARRHGWSRHVILDARTGMRVLLAMAGATTPPIRSSDVPRLTPLDLPARTVRAVLAETGMLEEDRPDVLEAWFERRIAALPGPMAGELRTWYQVLRNGSTTSPRSRPRRPGTVKNLALAAVPTLAAWADEGCQSLREITREQVIAALPPSGTPRAKLGRALKSIFAILKAHKVVFANPAARVRVGHFERRIPLPANQDLLAAALNSEDPATAAVAALMIFHGLRAAEVRDLQLTDVRDGHCYLPDRVVLLARPVRTRLAAYLDHRHARWPGSINPHFFIHYKSALGTGPVSRHWVNDHLGMPARAIRQDRMVDEALATAGDLRRICDLFGVTIATAQHYTSVLNHPDMIWRDSDPSIGTVQRT